MTVPDPSHPYPLPHHIRAGVFRQPTITSEKVEVGEYTYYDASQDTGSFEVERALYGFGPQRLLMGKFCAIAATVVGGNPARLIKQRYPDAEVSLLEQAAWWDWPIEDIRAHAATSMAGTPADLAAATRCRVGTQPCG